MYLSDLKSRFGVKEITASVTDNALVMRAGTRKADIERLVFLFYILLFIKQCISISVSGVYYIVATFSSWNRSRNGRPLLP